MKANVLAPVTSTALRLRIAASSVLRLSPDAMARQRRQPVVVGQLAAPLALLKHADDQTVTATWAVINTLTGAGWTERSFTDWGVVVAPNLFSRISVAQSIVRFQHEGPWGISPHLIPHQSLHAASGTISQALKIHGPNFGISGGPNAAPDAFLLAAALLADGTLPGVWLVLTGFESETIPGRAGQPSPAVDCLGIAMALTTDDSAGGDCLVIGQHQGAFAPPLPDFQLATAAPAWPFTAKTRYRLTATHWLEFEPDSLVQEEQA